MSRFDYKLLAEKPINRISHGLDAPGKGLIFVFAFLGTKLYKDKVMGLTDQGSEGRLAAVPWVIFANWREVLNQARLPEPTRAGYALAIGGYLDYCRRNGLSVSKESARGFMADVEWRQLARNPGLWKNGLNWLFVQGRRSSAWVPGGEPTPGHADTGVTPWERRLIGTGSEQIIFSPDVAELRPEQII